MIGVVIVILFCLFGGLIGYMRFKKSKKKLSPEEIEFRKGKILLPTNKEYINNFEELKKKTLHLPKFQNKLSILEKRK